MSTSSNSPKPVIKRKLKSAPDSFSIAIGWLTRAANLSTGKTLNVALAIWHAAAIQNKPTIRLYRYHLEKYGVAKDATYPALDKLAQAGLITAERCRGKVPVITVVTDLT